MKQKEKTSAESGQKKNPVPAGGILAGIIIFLLAIALITAFMMEDSGKPAAAPGCDPVTGVCTLTTQTTPVTAEPVKSARPAVDLYIMSFCPFGVQVENVMKPVVELLGNRTDIRVIYIATVKGTDISTARSLHGTAEAIEDTRQLCIAKHAPGTFWDYIAAFNAKCYPVWTNSTQLAACQAEVVSDLAIPADRINACVTGTEGFDLLKADELQAGSTGTTASPTLFINGQKYSGSRTSEAIKQAICNHFESTPDVCDVVLSSTATAASGSC